VDQIPAVEIEDHNIGFGVFRFRQSDCEISCAERGRGRLRYFAALRVERIRSRTGEIFRSRPVYIRRAGQLNGAVHLHLHHRRMPEDNPIEGLVSLRDRIEFRKAACHD